MHFLSIFSTHIEWYVKVLRVPFLLSLSKSSQKIPDDQKIQLFIFFSKLSTMAGSYENLSVQDQTVHSSILTIKQQQNLLIDLEPCKYEPFMLLIVECLKYSPLTIVVTEMENVPLSMISKAYTFANYIK